MHGQLIILHLFDMPFLSIIPKPNKSKDHTTTFVYYFLFVKIEFHFTLRKAGPAKTGAAKLFQLTL